MEHLRLINIQGKYATAFWMKDQNGKNFRSVLETLTKGQVALISSRYRTDLFYHYHEDKLELIVRMWNMLKGHAFNSNMLKYFTARSGKEEVLKYFFMSLFQLTRRPEAFKSYCEQFTWLLKSEPKSGILKEINDCNGVIIDKIKDESHSKVLMEQLDQAIHLLSGEDQTNVLTLRALFNHTPN